MRTIGIWSVTLFVFADTKTLPLSVCADKNMFYNRASKMADGGGLFASKVNHQNDDFFFVILHIDYSRYKNLNLEAHFSDIM